MGSELLKEQCSVFDYGCGRGGDLTILRGLGIACSGWDPVHQPESALAESDVVNLGYVVNVIEDVEERADALRKAWALARRVLIVSARLDVEARRLDHRDFADGCLTRRGTFQKFYSQDELRRWIADVLGLEPIAAAPGVFFLFRDELERQSFAAARFRRAAAVPKVRRSDALFAEHRQLLATLIDFLAARGRPPDRSELDLTPVEAVFGSLRRALALVERVTGREQWDQIRADRTQDLLVYLALGKFGGRAKFAALPLGMQLDVKAFFGAYSDACHRADELLFSAGHTATVDRACAAAPCGKLTSDALYVHTSAIGALPPVLRVYEGAARCYVGAVEGANLVKLHRHKPKVSYLSYPDFDRDPHPALSGALVVPLDDFAVKYWDYADSENPPVLHRKETFVAPGYPGRDKFARLTQQEERAGLLEETTRIGRRAEWQQALAKFGVALRGHRLVRRPSDSGSHDATDS